MSSLGTFYGVGVGPGDPDLLTVKAVKVMAAVDVVFAAGHERSGKSLAAEIVAPHCEREIVELPFPHTFESVAGQGPHREAAEKIAAVLKEGRSAAFLTLGDPMTFSTFTYVLAAVRELLPDAPVTVVPGVTSFAAAAAATLTPLAEGEESLAVLGAAKGTEALRSLVGLADNLVIMKPYRKSGEVSDILDAEGLADHTWFCTECSRPTERVARGTAPARAATGRYMSLFLVRKGRSFGKS